MSVVGDAKIYNQIATAGRVRQVVDDLDIPALPCGPGEGPTWLTIQSCALVAPERRLQVLTWSPCRSRRNLFHHPHPPACCSEVGCLRVCSQPHTNFQTSNAVMSLFKVLLSLLKLLQYHTLWPKTLKANTVQYSIHT